MFLQSRVLFTFVSLMLLTCLVSGNQTICLAQKKAASGGADKSSSFKAEEVSLRGATVQLAGTLLLPKIEAGKRAPALVIYGDAEPATRDGIPAGEGMHFLYRDLAEQLASRGIAVLRFDRPCSGKSGCQHARSFDDFIVDGESVLKYMRERPDIDTDRIAIFGHGRGGLQAMVVASHDEANNYKLAGVILAATAGRFGSRVIREHVKLILEAQGQTRQQISARLQKVDEIFEELKQGISDFARYKLDPNDQADVLLIHLTKDPAFAFGLLGNDPLQIVKTVRPPVLILQGDKDVLITTDDADYLDEAFLREGHQDYQRRIIKDADYVFKVNKGEASLKSLADATRPWDQSFFTILTEWLQKRLKVTGE